MPGLLNFFLLTLRLNFRSRQALVYGYLVPIFFLFAFGSVFRGGNPPLLREMGQLLTISTLGGCCFGLPTALVAERERGIWRRYRLLPVSTGALLAMTLLARFVLVATAAVMQIVLARLAYGTPWPAHPLELLISFCFVAFAFLGMGLVIAALAENVPAVQALGQSIFLPMIMIGGVGVPLRVLPMWARKVSAFLPGRYAVESLQQCFASGGGLSHAAFALLALFIIGITALVAGIALFRWDIRQPISSRATVWIIGALVPWIALGAIAASNEEHYLPPISSEMIGSSEPFESITDAQIAKITYTGLPDDDGTVTPLVKTVEGLTGEPGQHFNAFLDNLKTWPPGQTGSAQQRIRNLLCVAGVADIEQDAQEGRIARAVLNQIESDFDKPTRIKLLAWVIFHPKEEQVITVIPELGLEDPVQEDVLRDRCVIYAEKFLGRQLGKLPSPAGN